jgi:LPS O-antigen subunit length determinant protein (WzzB/FepE family)
MKKEEIKYNKNEIEFISLVQNIWKKKLFILSMCVFFFIIGFFYNLFLLKKYQTDLTLKPFFRSHLVSFSSIINYFGNDFSSKGSNHFSSVIFELENDFNVNLISRSNFISFINQSNDEKLKKNLHKITIKNFKDIYSIYYYEGVDGEKILKDYILFTKENLIKETRKNLNFIFAQVENDLLIEQGLLIKKKNLISQNKTSNLNSKKAEENFEKLSFPLLNSNTQKIDLDFLYLKKRELDNYKIDVVPFYESSLQTKLISGTFKILYPIIGLLFGFFASLIIIFSRNILNIKI